jgi:hypothetical protein
VPNKKQLRPPKPAPHSTAKRANKFSARKTLVDGIEFDSDAESRRYLELVLLERAGEISNLELQPVFILQPSFKVKTTVLTPEGRTRTKTRTIRAITYRADFRYTDSTGQVVVEDVKGVETEAFRLKAKMTLYVHGVEVIKVKMARER